MMLERRGAGGGATRSSELVSEGSLSAVRPRPWGQGLPSRPPAPRSPGSGGPAHVPGGWPAELAGPRAPWRTWAPRLAASAGRRPCPRARLALSEAVSSLPGVRRGCQQASPALLSPQGPLLRWLKVNFSEAFIAWIHLKALRVFVESVLRCVAAGPSPGCPAGGAGGAASWGGPPGPPPAPASPLPPGPGPPALSPCCSWLWATCVGLPESPEPWVRGGLRSCALPPSPAGPGAGGLPSPAGSVRLLEEILALSLTSEAQGNTNTKT